MEKNNSYEVQYYKLKKRLLVVALFLRFFFCGVEYSVILPTALIYLKSLNANNVFMGVVVALYPLAAMIFLPIFGYLYDKTKRIKELLLILNMFEIIGNILYALSYSKWFPAVGRFISGIGDAFLSLAVGELTYLYSKQARLGILSIMELGRVLGLILGPMLNFFIADKSYIVNGLVFDNKTLPAVIMAINWIIMQLITFICVHNLVRESQINSEKSDQEAESIPFNTESDVIHHESLPVEDTSSFLFQFDAESLNQEQVETASFIAPAESPLISRRESEGKVKKQVKAEGTWEIIKQLFAVEFFVIFMVDLVLWYSQTVFEILMPYITEFDYGFSPAFTGIVYVVGGIELTIVFGILIATSGRMKDSYLLIIALIFTQLSLALVIYEASLKYLKSRFIVFVIVCVLVFGTLPLNLVSSKSLITKLIPEEHQGMIQGIYSSVSRIALVCGPILGSAVFEKRQIYGAVFSGFCFIAIIAMFCVLRKFDKREEEMADVWKEDHMQEIEK